MNFNSTVKGSELEGFYPAGWDFDKIDACIDAPEKITERQSHWNAGFTPVQCNNLGEFETYMGHEIAMQIKLAKDRKEKIAFSFTFSSFSSGFNSRLGNIKAIYIATQIRYFRGIIPFTASGIYNSSFEIAKP